VIESSFVFVLQIVGFMRVSGMGDSVLGVVTSIDGNGTGPAAPSEVAGMTFAGCTKLPFTEFDADTFVQSFSFV
jgi:hypothetical protein